jgi:hypothetical protein
MLYRIGLTVQYRDDPDFTVHLALIGLVSGFEVWFGIIIACIPTLAPLFRPATYRSKYRSNESGSGGGYRSHLTPVQLASNGTSSRKYARVIDGSEIRLQDIHNDDTTYLNPGTVKTNVSHNPESIPDDTYMPSNAIHVRTNVESHR